MDKRCSTHKTLRTYFILEKNHSVYEMDLSSLRRINYFFLRLLTPNAKTWLLYWILFVNLIFLFCGLLLTLKNNKSSLSSSSSETVIELNPALMTGRQMLDYLHWSNSSSCRLSQDYGGVQLGILRVIDGQKAVCLDPEVRPIPGHCIVYSFGIDTDWSFEEAMEQYGCLVYAFDPSINMSNHYHTKGVQFFNLGLGNGDHEFDQAADGGPGYRLQSLEQIYNRLRRYDGGHEVIDYLKIDIEEEEWNSLPQILESRILDKYK